LSAQLAEIWCSWKEATCLFGEGRANIEKVVMSKLKSTLPYSKASFALTGHTNFTLAPFESSSMLCVNKMMRAPNVEDIRVRDVSEGGYHGLAR